MVKKPTAYVAYLRVSTQRQGESGLGLEAQRAAVASFIAQHGGCAVSEHVEVESGKRSDRPQLAKALDAARNANNKLRNKPRRQPRRSAVPYPWRQLSIGHIREARPKCRRAHI